MLKARCVSIIHRQDPSDPVLVSVGIANDVGAKEWQYVLGWRRAKRGKRLTTVRLVRQTDGVAVGAGSREPTDGDLRAATEERRGMSVERSQIGLGNRRR